MILYTMYMSYKGKYRPEHPRKYKGDPTNIIYRSLWERKFMRYCDLNESIYQWQSGEFAIPYKSPLDHRYHRYFGMGWKRTDVLPLLGDPHQVCASFSRSRPDETAQR
mgnify:CR=1 FL=1